MHQLRVSNCHVIHRHGGKDSGQGREEVVDGIIQGREPVYVFGVHDDCGRIGVINRGYKDRHSIGNILMNL